MVNSNNGIPIEVNKKPFEIVQEVNNEIPSYEEFLKNYENDGNLNYADLNGGNLGTQQSYGPGVDSPSIRKWCSHCIENKEVSSSTSYCPTCGNSFGTVAKSAEINRQIDQNRKQVAEKGGTYEYYEEEGTKADGSNYSRRGSSYTGPK